jgi:microcystin-dependent protein
VDPFVAEIRMFGFNFAPRGWAFCDGQLLPLSQNTALFALLGTMYGGDGKSNFALPDLQGNAPMFWGQGGGLSDHYEGEMDGSQTVTLLQSEMPFHTHTVPGPTISLAGSQGASIYVTGSPTPQQMNFQGLAPYGTGGPHNNMQPYLTLNFCIALQGVFPPRG